MIFRAAAIFDLRQKNGEVRTIVSGEIFCLNDADGQRLLSCKPHLVQTLKTVRWQSPLFGALEGEVLMSTEGTDLLVAHPIIGEPAWIPLSWMINDLEKGQHAHSDR